MSETSQVEKGKVLQRHSIHLIWSKIKKVPKLWYGLVWLGCLNRFVRPAASSTSVPNVTMFNFLSYRRHLEVLCDVIRHIRRSIDTCDLLPSNQNICLKVFPNCLFFVTLCFPHVRVFRDISSETYLPGSFFAVKIFWSTWVYLRYPPVPL